VIQKYGKHYSNSPIGSFPAHSKNRPRVNSHSGNSRHKILL
jgi:hypothetical protein